MKKAQIRKVQELVNGEFYYKVMLKADSFFSFWYTEFKSKDEAETDKKYTEILRARNIRAYDE